MDLDGNVSPLVLAEIGAEHHLSIRSQYVSKRFHLPSREFSIIQISFRGGSDREEVLQLFLGTSTHLGWAEKWLQIDNQLSIGSEAHNQLESFPEWLTISVPVGTSGERTIIAVAWISIESKENIYTSVVRRSIDWMLCAYISITYEINLSRSYANYIWAELIVMKR